MRKFFFLAAAGLLLCGDISGQDWSVADSIVKYQMPSGGWPKNQNWKNGADAAYMRRCGETGVGSTIDNGATTDEMRLLAKAYTATFDQRYRESFIKGLTYLLDMQYDNGGFPQFFPVRKEAPYSAHITFNDNAMVNVLRLLRDVSDEREDFLALCVSETMRKRCADAFNRGVQCILKCQVKKNGKLSVWCQQHHEVSLEPVGARAYELPSLTGHGETVGIIMLLSEIPNPSQEVTSAVSSAVGWLREHAIRDMMIENFVNADGKKDKRLVNKKGAPLLWARYYDLENEEPMFCDRDGIPKKHLEEIGYERRNGYSWIGDTPQKVLDLVK